MMKKLDLFLYNTIVLILFHAPVFFYIILYKIFQPEIIGEIILLFTILPITLILIGKVLIKLEKKFKRDHYEK